MDALEHRHADEMGELRRQLERVETATAANLASPAVATGEDTQAGSKTTAAPAVNPATAFNPSITVFANLVARVDDRPVVNAEGNAIDDRINLREVEIDLRAPIAPFADGVVIAAFESETAGEFEAGIEEGYFDLYGLPGLERMPASLRLRTGRFRPRFGRLNQAHTHDLPQTTRPRSLKTFLGEEGLISNGAAAEFFVPTPGDANALTATLTITNGGEIPATEANDGEDPAFLAHLGWFFQLGDSSELEIGVSGQHGKSDQAGLLDAELYGGDITYKWKPNGGSRSRSVLAGAEVFSARIDLPGGGSISPLGYYIWTQAQVGPETYLGIRFDDSEEIDDETVSTDSIGAYITRYMSEFLRLRLGWEHTSSDISELDGLDTALLELNFVFGTHPVHPYWVNR